MAIDSAPRSRRAILAAGLGGLAATVVGALARPQASLAANGDPVLAGSPNSATAETSLAHTGSGVDGGLKVTTTGAAAAVYGQGTNGANGVSGVAADGQGVTAYNTATNVASAWVFNAGNSTGLLGMSGTNSTILPSPTPKTGVFGWANQDANARGVYGKSGPGTGVHGESASGKGTYGRSTSSTGARGQSDSGIGVWGTSLTNRGVFGTSNSSTLPGIGGQSTTGKAGVHGYGGPGTPPEPTDETGVEGVCNISTGANGVVGKSTSGAGVWGTSVGGLGVIGSADGDAIGNGVGVYGFGPIGVFGEGAYAGWFAGPTFFTESGKTTISSGSAKTFGIPNGLRPNSLVLAVLHTNRAGVWVRAVVPNAAAGTATVYLNTAVSSLTAIAWFVVN